MMALIFTLNTIFFILALGGFGVCIWALFCNQKTLKERLAIIDYVYRADGLLADEERNGAECRRNYRNVTYDKHLYTNMILKDYRKLYPAIYKLPEEVTP